MLTRLRALLTLLRAFLFALRRLPRDLLSVRTKGVDKQLLTSNKGKRLRAFVDGSVTADGGCGFSVHYDEEHQLNFHGGFNPGSVPAESNLAELAALYWVLRHHPRGQRLSIFSDSLHALRVVQSVCAEDEDGGGSSGRESKRERRQRAKSGKGGDSKAPSSPRMDPRELSLARAIWWLLRLRTAQTSFHKVPAHKGFAQNVAADALARRAAEGNGPKCDLPLFASYLALFALLWEYLLGQSQLDGGLGLGGSMTAADGNGSETRSGIDEFAAHRPQPLGPSTELTHVLALDCEMVGVGFRAFGGESRLASVSIVNEFGNQVYYSYAKPARPVTDYRTRYSGIASKDLVDAPPAAQVQKEVRELIEGHVIVGHGLENDFRVLGFFPPRHMLRDSAHDVKKLCSPRGKPRKLRHITWEFLGLIIQDSTSGHDPLEDARAALYLYLRFKRDFELQAERRRFDFVKQQKAKAEAAARDKMD